MTIRSILDRHKFLLSLTGIGIFAFGSVGATLGIAGIIADAIISRHRLKMTEDNRSGGVASTGVQPAPLINDLWLPAFMAAVFGYTATAYWLDVHDVSVMKTWIRYTRDLTDQLAAWVPAIDHYTAVLESSQYRDRVAVVRHIYAMNLVFTLAQFFCCAYLFKGTAHKFARRFSNAFTNMSVLVWIFVLVIFVPLDAAATYFLYSGSGIEKFVTKFNQIDGAFLFPLTLVVSIFMSFWFMLAVTIISSREIFRFSLIDKRLM